MKLSAKNLMLGDWYQWYAEGKYYYYQVSVETFKEDTTNFEPIPLTPEILKKNGFKEEVREKDPTFPYSAFILDENEYHIEITWYDSHDIYEPYTGQFMGGVPEVWTLEVNNKRGNVDIEYSNKMYVHDLQHALKLCGIEKEIIL